MLKGAGGRSVALTSAVGKRLRRPRLAKRHKPPLLLIPQREPDASEAAPESEPADLAELGMVPKDLGKPIEGNAARQVMHLMHADIGAEPAQPGGRS